MFASKIVQWGDIPPPPNHPIYTTDLNLLESFECELQPFPSHLTTTSWIEKKINSEKWEKTCDVQFWVCVRSSIINLFYSRFFATYRGDEFKTYLKLYTWSK